ncbi:class F sortase [Leifsonia aquatica]|uniref:class F sortase n=1 Tax=Leifsonia aquatica TaxID=144185 RepID=UPI00046A270C|nr:class F sortase [Leifsonia aquatica]
MTVRHRRRRIRGGAVAQLAVLVLVFVALVAAGATLVAHTLGSAAEAVGSAAASSAAAPRAVAEPAPGQTAAPAGAPPEERPLVPGQPTRVDIPSIGLSVNVGRMAVPAGGTVDPPTARSAYWLSEYGAATADTDNTVYIAGHTYRGGAAAFNPLLDVPHSSYTVHPGDHILVTVPEGRVDYVVDDTELYEKVDVAQQAELWKRVPGRLVLVTCFQYDGGTSSHQNFVVYAHRS